jgi:uncharacterized protein YegP (UPF0339 family)
MANIEFYQDESDKKDWRWRVKASNGQNIGKSSEGYSSRSAAENNLTAIPRIAIPSNIKIAAAGEADENPKFAVQFYQDESEKKDCQ